MENSMDLPKNKVAGSILIHLKPLRDISISEIRNNITFEDPADIDTSLHFYYQNMDDSIFENSFNIPRYEELKELSKSYYEMELSYSTKPAWELKIELKNSSYYYLIIKESDDIVSSYAYLLSSLQRKKINFNLIKKLEVNDMIRIGDFDEMLADGISI
jgi:hypothetical protein